MAATATAMRVRARTVRAAGVGVLEVALERPGVWTIAVAGLLSLQLALTLTHRPWLDEYQSLQIALQSPDLRGLMANLRYEGHPPLWYLMLRAAGGVVPTRWVLPVVAAPLAMVTQATILARAPFARLDRLMLASGAFALFEYGTLSRSLTLGVALLVLAFAFRDRRLGWLPLALLPMADFLFGALSLVVLAVRARERRLWWPGLIGWAAIAALAAWSIRPAADVQPAFAPGGVAFEIGAWLNRLSIMLLPLQIGGDGSLEWNNPLPLGLASVAGPLFIVFGVRRLRADPFHLALWAAFAGLTLAFSVFCYPLSIRHLSLVALLLILLKWRAAERGAEPDPAFRLWLAASSACGLLSAGVACARPFDTAPEAAAAIARLKLADAHWVSFPSSRGQGVSALTGVEFDRIGADCAQEFIRWNVHERVRKSRDLVLALRGLTARYGRLELLSDIPLDSVEATGLIRPIAAIPAGYDGQAFHLYVVRPDLPATRLRPPPCVPGQRPLRWRD